MNTSSAQGSVFSVCSCVCDTVTLRGLSSVKPFWWANLGLSSSLSLLGLILSLFLPPPPSLCVCSYQRKLLSKEPFEKHMVFQFCDRYLLLFFRMVICLRVEQWQHYCPVKLLKASDLEMISGGWGKGDCMMFCPVDTQVSWWKTASREDLEPSWWAKSKHKSSFKWLIELMC